MHDTRLHTHAHHFCRHARSYRGLSFFIIAVWWVAHHRLFRYIIGYDAALMWRNLVFLLFITIIPFLTEILDQYGDIEVALIIYNLSQFMGGLALNSVWNHATSKQLLISKSLTQDQVRNIRLRGYVPSIVFALAIGVSFLLPPGISPATANLTLFAMFPLLRIVGRKNTKD
ncbi:MAG TPA: TMEM175 family protein [Nitrososphaerales archaeon]|nr:TMEM175 family protein [Nitrososphaerales archaeon]